MTSERRKYSRYQISCGAEIVCDAGLLHGTMLEISVEGARLNVPKAPTPGTGVTVNIDLNRKIMIRGTILWTLENGTSGIPTFQVGIDTEHFTMDGEEAAGFGQRTHFVQEIVLSLKSMN